MPISFLTTEDLNALETRVAALEATPPGGWDEARIAALEARSVEHFNSGSNSEMVSSLPPGGAKQQCYQLSLSPLKAGDILIAGAEIEGTNNAAFNADFGAKIMLSEDPSATAGEQVTEETVFNVSPNMHHGVYTKAGTFMALQDYATPYLTLVCWSQNGMSIIEQDYGRLWCVKLSGW